MVSPVVAFDLDGTLVDTAPDLIDTLNALLARERLEPVDFAEARRLIGGGARRLIERALAVQGRACAPEDIDELYVSYIARYAERIADRSRPFPGVDNALDTLARQGCTLAVCTNKLEWLSRRLLDALGMSGRFAAICGQDTFGVQKPHPDMLRNTVLAAGGVISAAVMVGDSATDISTARAACVPVVAVDFGYTDAPVATFAPDRIVSDFRRLPEAVLELLAERRA